MSSLGRDVASKIHVRNSAVRRDEQCCFFIRSVFSTSTRWTKKQTRGPRSSPSPRIASGLIFSEICMGRPHVWRKHFFAPRIFKPVLVLETLEFRSRTGWGFCHGFGDQDAPERRSSPIFVVCRSLLNSKGATDCHVLTPRYPRGTAPAGEPRRRRSAFRSGN
jgi:hypothetical protein